MRALPPGMYSMPQYAARVSSAFSGSLVFAAYPLGNSWYDAVTGSFATNTNGVSFAAFAKPPKTAMSNAGIGLTGSASGHFKFTNRTGADGITGNHTVFIEGSIGNAGSNLRAITSWENSFGNGFDVAWDDASVVNNSFRYRKNNGSYASATTNSLGANSENFAHRIAVTHDGTNATFYAGGVLINAVANSGSPTANTARRTKIAAAGSNADTEGHASSNTLILVFNRVLFDAEIQRLAFNPWIVFTGKSARIYSFPADAGGVTTSPYYAYNQMMRG